MTLLSITKNKSFLADCEKYESIIEKTKDSELSNLYRQFKVAAKNIDESFNSPQITSVNFRRHAEERSQLQSIRKKIEKRVSDLADSR